MQRILVYLSAKCNGTDKLNTYYKFGWKDHKFKDFAMVYVAFPVKTRKDKNTSMLYAKFAEEINWKVNK